MSTRQPDARQLTTMGATSTTHNGETTWWFQEPDAAVRDWIERHGVVPDRRLHQMRVPLPLDGPPPAATREFRVGVDEELLLAVNNRAFAGHPDQGGWSLEDLGRRMAEGWFDPDDCRVLDLGDTGLVDGFCWMKLHDSVPAMGEIHVIALDPSLHGRGLGAPLVAAGLEWASRRHGVRVGMLYVEADNEIAVRLYRSLGFTVHHTDLGLVGPPPR